MDPVAHTLVGATLAEAGLKKLSRYASATLIIGANLPDLDAVAQLWGEDISLYVRRGWSHGILAMLVLPLLLAGLVWTWHRWRGHRQSEAPPFRPWIILAFAFLGVWSHPALDWLNTYGVRLLMPFSDRWFYGDTLFIIDPWFWLLSAAALVLACNHRGGLIGWALLAALASWLILSTSLAAPVVKILWLCGIAAIVAARWRGITASTWSARLGLASLTLYIGSAYGLARLAESEYHSSGEPPLVVQANPTPGNPFRHRLVTVHESFYRVITDDGRHIEIPRVAPDTIVQAAMTDESIKGFIQWMRFPYWIVKETDDSWIVEFRDLRYLVPDEKPRGIGYAKVKVSKAAAQDFSQ
ncbi:MAG: metal-dependent hydrolase [Cellvibrionaceae bacterium]|nr:metal-dependent hydrolase [Cellvibrionaceae bacterium]